MQRERRYFFGIYADYENAIERIETYVEIFTAFHEIHARRAKLEHLITYNKPIV